MNYGSLAFNASGLKIFSDWAYVHRLFMFTLDHLYMSHAVGHFIYHLQKRLQDVDDLFADLLRPDVSSEIFRS